jgi:hypothetical protein
MEIVKIHAAFQPGPPGGAIETPTPPGYKLD